MATHKGHQLHFRTNSEASKHVWLQFVANAIADYDLAGHMRPAVQRLRTNVVDFYTGYSTSTRLCVRACRPMKGSEDGCASLAVRNRTGYSGRRIVRGHGQIESHTGAAERQEAHRVLHAGHAQPTHGQDERGRADGPRAAPLLLAAEVRRDPP